MQPKLVVIEKTTKNSLIDYNNPNQLNSVMKCVITSDVVNSTKISAGKRDLLLSVLQRIENDLQTISVIDIEVYRGDSFQVLVEDAAKGMLCAILIRAGLMCFAPEEEKWDARLSLGIGDVQYENRRVTMSDGDAFRLSGRTFDEIGKRRLVVTTISDDINEELTLSCAFADDIISGWSKKQAQLMYQVLLNGTPRKELADLHSTSVQNIGKKLRAAKENLVVLFLKRFELLIKKI